MSFAAAHFATVDTANLDWARPYLDAARASLKKRGGLSLEEFNAHIEKRLSELN